MGKRILIVDDSLDDVGYLIGFFQKNSHYVTHVKYARRGMEELDTDIYDAAVFDMHLPLEEGGNRNLPNGMKLAMHARNTCPGMPFVIHAGHLDVSPMTDLEEVLMVEGIKYFRKSDKDAEGVLNYFESEWDKE